MVHKKFQLNLNGNIIAYRLKCANIISKICLEVLKSIYIYIRLFLTKTYKMKYLHT